MILAVHRRNTQSILKSWNVYQKLKVLPWIQTIDYDHLQENLNQLQKQKF